MVSKNTAADRSSYIFIQHMDDLNVNHALSVYNKPKIQVLSVKMQL